MGFICWVAIPSFVGVSAIVYVKNSTGTLGGMLIVPDMVKGIVTVGINCGPCDIILSNSRE